MLHASSFVDELLKALQQHPFTSDLHIDHLAKLAHCCRFTRVYTDNYVFRENQKADRFYLLQSGTVMLETEQQKSRTTSIQTVGSGKLLGCSWVFEPHIWRFDARALSPTEMIEFDANKVRSLFAEDHELGFQLLRRVIKATFERLESTRFQLLDLYDQDAK